MRAHYIAMGLVAFEASFPSNARDGPVIGIADGDAIEVMLDGSEVPIRLSSIDAPMYPAIQLTDPIACQA